MKKSPTLKRRRLSPILLVIASAAIAFPITARAGFEKLQGNYPGNYHCSSTDGVTPTENGGGARVGVKATNERRGGIFTINGPSYIAKITCKPNGVCTTDAIVPGLIAESARGTWASHNGGRRVTYTLTAHTPSGDYTAKGTIVGNGIDLQITIKFKGTMVSPGAPTEGIYTYTGQR